MDAPAILTEMCVCTLSLAHCDAGWERPSHHSQLNNLVDLKAKPKFDSYKSEFSGSCNT